MKWSDLDEEVRYFWIVVAVIFVIVVCTTKVS